MCIPRKSWYQGGKNSSRPSNRETSARKRVGEQSPNLDLPRGGNHEQQIGDKLQARSIQRSLKRAAPWPEVLVSQRNLIPERHGWAEPLLLLHDVDLRHSPPEGVPCVQAQPVLLGQPLGWQRAQMGGLCEGSQADHHRFARVPEQRYPDGRQI